MKKYHYILFMCSLVFLSSCNKDIDSFDNSKNYIYFDVPFKVDDYGNKTTTRVDSIYYSFALDDASITSHTFKIPINTISLPANKDRSYKVEVVTDKTTAEDTDWDKTCLENTIVKAGSVFDTLLVKVNRTSILRKAVRSITFRIVGNENFSEGYNNLLTAKISFSDVLDPPSWWSKWQYIFGDYCREKYLKWREIYYLGADPNVELYAGPGKGKELYWDNMPYYAFLAFYPSTAMFLRVLKQYFIDNEVYPDGDKTKPRVTIPYTF
jgi:hypothetical protein